MVRVTDRARNYLKCVEGAVKKKIKKKWIVKLITIKLFSQILISYRCKKAFIKKEKKKAFCINAIVITASLKKNKKKKKKKTSLLSSR